VGIFENGQTVIEDLPPVITRLMKITVCCQKYNVSIITASLC